MAFGVCLVSPVAFLGCHPVPCAAFPHTCPPLAGDGGGEGMEAPLSKRERSRSQSALYLLSEAISSS